MSETIERRSHVVVTRRTADGVTHTEVTEVHVVMPDRGTSDVPAARRASAGRSEAEAADAGPDDRFDPATCCSAREQAVIATLRAYLRPQTAPDCLIALLHAVLDDCCR